GADLHAVVAGDEEDAVRVHGVADVGVEAGDVQLLVLLDLELLPADFYDSVHGGAVLGSPARASRRSGGPAEERIWGIRSPLSYALRPPTATAAASIFSAPRPA